MTRFHPLLAVGLTTALTACVLPARADEKGDKILQKAFRKLFAAKAMTADITSTITGDGLPEEGIELKGTVSALKPNYLRVELKGETPRGAFLQTYVSDGKSYFSYDTVSKQYTKEKVSLTPTEFLGMWEGEIDAFFGGEKNALKVKTDYEGEELFNKMPCEIVKTEAKGLNNSVRTITYTIGKRDSIIYRAVFSAGNPDESNQSQTNVLTNIKLTANKTPADFSYTPPKGAKLRTPPPPPLDRAEVQITRRGRLVRR
jgi:outer membrane lipoprotein-sorting protein